MGWGKWIGAGIGFSLGGYIGAIIGYAIGAMFEGNNNSMLSDNDYQGEQQTTYTSTHQTRRTRPTPDDIRVCILVLSACVMKADGYIKKSELDVVKRFLIKNYPEDKAKEALQTLKGLLKQDIDYSRVCQQIRGFVNYSTRLEILHFLLDLAHADGNYASQEQYLIEHIVVELGLNFSDYQSLLALYNKQKDPNWAYQALEIESTATDEEIKKAYRRMAMKYHPDKVASAGEDIKQHATEKFRAINQAYEYLKTIRGLK